MLIIALKFHWMETNKKSLYAEINTKIYRNCMWWMGKNNMDLNKIQVGIADNQERVKKSVASGRMMCVNWKIIYEILYYLICIEVQGVVKSSVIEWAAIQSNASKN